MDDLRELEAQADEERRQIVGKYAAGRARTDHIDDWEDPGRYDYYIHRIHNQSVPWTFIFLVKSTTICEP